MNMLFPPDIQNIFKHISLLSIRLKTGAYLVGGIVRDILLNNINLDIDIVVERNGINFARELCGKLKGKLYTHEKFKTSVIVLENGKHIDIATARVEYYERPAALPSVEEGSIKQDLYRRDFTINSMAISLEKEKYNLAKIMIDEKIKTKKKLGD